MKNKIIIKKLLSFCLSLTLMASFLSGCGSTEQTQAEPKKTETEVIAEPVTETEAETVQENEEDDTLTGAVDYPVYIEAVPGISDDFIRGMDASAVLAEENSGVKYYNFDGEEQDVFQTFSEAGVNYIRLRVWNDPYDENGNGYGGGNNDLAAAVEMGKRATEYGMKVCIDFHYSDFWADPKRQHVPKAWENMELEEKEQALYDYTHISLTQLLDAGVDVEMVQIGNEINFGMAGEYDIENVNELLKYGSKAVRDISELYGRNIDIVVHYTRITEPGKLYDLIGNLEKCGLDYDTVGLSFYPFWDGSFSNMKKVVSKIRNDYGKNVIIAETSYCYTSEDGDGYGNSLVGTTDLVEGYPASVQGQASIIRDVIANANEAGASGVFYWEGAWIPVGDANDDNSAIWEKYGSGWASSYASDYDPEDAGLYYGGSSWDNQAFFDFDGKPLYSINLWKYLKYGTTLESAQDYTPIEKTADEDEELPDYSYLENLIKNPGFEDADTSMWKVTYKGDVNPTDFFENSSDAYTGDYSFHFYSGESDMDFSIEQEFTGLEPGTYYLTAFSQGGDFNDNASFELYALTNDGELTDPFELTSYIDWKNPTIPEIKVTDGNLTIGVRIRANVASWGTVDDFALYKLED